MRRTTTIATMVVAMMTTRGSSSRRMSAVSKRMTPPLLLLPHPAITPTVSSSRLGNASSPSSTNRRRRRRQFKHGPVASWNSDGIGRCNHRALSYSPRFVACRVDCATARWLRVSLRFRHWHEGRVRDGSIEKSGNRGGRRGNVSRSDGRRKPPPLSRRRGEAMRPGRNLGDTAAAAARWLQVSLHYRQWREARGQGGSTRKARNVAGRGAHKNRNKNRNTMPRPFSKKSRNGRGAHKNSSTMPRRLSRQRGEAMRRRRSSTGRGPPVLLFSRPLEDIVVVGRRRRHTVATLLFNLSPSRQMRIRLIPSLPRLPMILSRMISPWTMVGLLPRMQLCLEMPRVPSMSVAMKM
mmetsp:Transcript_28695/g.58305  ORF Transcript_28695/g.58305 Transcript_28695/m.58305 type:complete len:351 (-) Transcript_28695:1905-2957(-)